MNIYDFIEWLSTATEEDKRRMLKFIRSLSRAE